MEYARPKPAACRGCPAYEWGLGFVPPQGPTSARVAIVGQGPGEQEAQQGVPFFEYAPSGHMLTQWVREAGVPRTQVWVGNVVQCWLPEGYRGRVPWGNRDPSHAEARWCWNAHVGPALAQLTHLQHVVAVGTAATRYLMGWSKDEPVERWCGTRQWVDLPTFGPNSEVIDSLLTAEGEPSEHTDLQA